MFAEMSEKYLHLAHVAILQRVITFLQLAGVDLAGLAGLQSAPGWASFPSHGADLPLFMAGLPLQNIIGNSDHHLSRPLSCSFLFSAVSLGAIWKQCTWCRESPACRFEATALSRQ